MKSLRKSKKKQKKILETVHDSATGFHRAGLIDEEKMVVFDSISSPTKKIKKTMNDIARDAISEMCDILNYMKKTKDSEK